MNKIDSFQGPYRFLSNFWPATVMLDGVDYPSVEHAYQAAKNDDPDYRMMIRVMTPGGAKRFARGKHLPGWQKKSLSVMEDLVRQKFQQEPLRSQLIETGNQELIEGNTWGDTFYGVCGGVGENHLGKILMKIRSELQ